MISKKLFLVVMLLLIPVFAHAEKRDMLLVSLDYTKSSDTAEIINLEERVLDDAGVNMSTKGDLNVTIADDKGLVSKNSYSLSSGTTIEVLGANDQGVYAPAPDVQLVTIGLPLSRSITIENATLTVEKDGKVLLERKLSDLPFELLESKTNRVLVKPEVRDFTASSTGHNFGKIISAWASLFIGGFFFLLLAIIAMARVRARRQNGPSIMVIPPVNPPPTT